MRKPVELKELDLKVLQELFDDIYGRLGMLTSNTAVDDTSEDFSAGYTESEVETLAAKVNEILATLRTAKILSE